MGQKKMIAFAVASLRFADSTYSKNMKKWIIVFVSQVYCILMQIMVGILVWRPGSWFGCD